MDEHINNSERTSISPSEDQDFSQSNYSECYKNNFRTKELSLQQRRETFLNEHKEKHCSMYDENRDLSDLFEECEDETDVESMEIDVLPRRKRIKFRATMSEWFANIPEDLSEKWLVKFCPLGKRRLVISHGGATRVYNKFGHRLFDEEFLSGLPGGKLCRSTKEGLTVLDCVLNEKTKTFFILDMLVWNSVSFLDCEAELRHNWMRSRYSEFPEMFSPYGKDSYRFQVLQDHPADRETIRAEIWRYDSQNEVGCDGLIFYHREAPYISGDTPLVTWLKPFMLPERLNIDIPQEYEKKRPSRYVDFESFLLYVTGKRKRVRRSDKMETEDIPINDESTTNN